MAGAQEFGYVDVSRIERRKLTSERGRFHLGALLVAKCRRWRGSGRTIAKAERELEEKVVGNFEQRCPTSILA
jgi:hypothetical protein